MPISVDGKTYYTTSEALKRAGIGKSTFLRWIKAGIIGDVQHADRRGWRLFTEEDISRIKAEASRIELFLKPSLTTSDKHNWQGGASCQREEVGIDIDGGPQGKPRRKLEER